MMEGTLTSWRRFVLILAGTAFGLTALLYGFIAVLDPYGLRTGPGGAARPIMDLNQRFMYPQIVRSGRFDSAVFGTSTARLLDPRALDEAFGGAFANLGLNAGTPWEQMQLADLFLRTVEKPKTLIFTLDRTWCAANADENRLTFRAFPPWLYDENRLNDYAEILSLKSLEIAGRVLLNRFGFMPERIRGDGYEVFVPPDETYDLERARMHLGQRDLRATSVRPDAVMLLPEERAAISMPALSWIVAILSRVPRETRVIFAFMPVHIVAQAPAGTREAAIDEECKSRTVDLARTRGATVVDFRFPSNVTQDDAQYWDPLHYRIGVAAKIIDALTLAQRHGRPVNGFSRVLAHRSE